MNIKIRNAVKEYNDKIVLSIDSLNFEKDRIYAVLGLNGSGKTTLLQCASGLDSFTKGEVHYDGIESGSSIRRYIAAMTQKPYLFNCSAEDNIKIGLKFRRFEKNDMESRILDYLSYFDIKALMKKNARKLSGGEQQKIALLRTAVIEAKMTFLDEPTASMDIESTFKAEKLIKEMVKDGRSVILVTHDLYQAERIADYILFLDKGMIIEAEETDKFFNFPKHKLVKQILRRGVEEHD